MIETCVGKLESRSSKVTGTQAPVRNFKRLNGMLTPMSKYSRVPRCAAVWPT